MAKALSTAASSRCITKPIKDIRWEERDGKVCFVVKLKENE